MNKEIKPFIDYDDFMNLDDNQRRESFMLLSKCFIICANRFFDVILNSLKKLEEIKDLEKEKE